jgi:hypothetical protein
MCWTLPLPVLAVASERCQHFWVLEEGMQAWGDAGIAHNQGTSHLLSQDAYLGLCISQPTTEKPSSQAPGLSLLDSTGLPGHWGTACCAWRKWASQSTPRQDNLALHIEPPGGPLLLPASFFVQSTTISHGPWSSPPVASLPPPSLLRLSFSAAMGPIPKLELESLPS